MDGAAEKLDWLFDICEELGIEILIDVHATRDSTGNGSREYSIIWQGQQNYTRVQKPDWLCNWDTDLAKCNDNVDQDHIQWSLA